MATPKTYSALMKHIADLQNQAETLRTKEVAGVIKRIQEAMVIYGLTAEQLDPSKKPKRKKPAQSRQVRRTSPTVVPRKKRPAKAKVREAVTKQGRGGKVGPRAVKYADNNGNKWAGGGSMPVWLRNELAGGKSLDDFLVIKKTA
jgi:DNA-binding protein H-NS